MAGQDLLGKDCSIAVDTVQVSSSMQALCQLLTGRIDCSGGRGARPKLTSQLIDIQVVVS
jgi:hypothetical protein